MPDRPGDGCRLAAGGLSHRVMTTVFRLATVLPLLIAGCIYTPLQYDLPTGAVLTQPTGRILSYIAPRDGTVFVRDQPADAVIFTAPIKFGQGVEVDAPNDRITFDHRPVVPARSL